MSSEAELNARRLGQLSKFSVKLRLFFINSNICFECSKEPYHRDGCFEYTTYFWLRNRKNNSLLRSLICGTDELPTLTCISHVLFISLGSLGD